MQGGDGKRRPIPLVSSNLGAEKTFKQVKVRACDLGVIGAVLVTWAFSLRVIWHNKKRNKGNYYVESKPSRSMFADISVMWLWTMRNLSGKSREQETSHLL